MAILTVSKYIFHRFTPPPPGWGDWRLLSVPDPWAACLDVVTDLTRLLDDRHAALVRHRDLLGATQDALDVILVAFGVESDALERIKADLVAQAHKVAAVGDTIDDAYQALADAQEVCLKEDASLSFINDCLLHYTRRLRELGPEDHH